VLECRSFLSTALKESLSSDSDYQSYAQSYRVSANYASPCINHFITSYFSCHSTAMSLVIYDLNSMMSLRNLYNKGK